MMTPEQHKISICIQKKKKEREKNYHKFRCNTQYETRSRPLRPEKNGKQIIDEIVENEAIFSLV